MKHPKTIKKFSGSLDELAKDISNLQYDSLELFLEHLSEHILNDSLKDEQRNRKKLSLALLKLGLSLKDAKSHASDAWMICEKYMK